MAGFLENAGNFLQTGLNSPMLIPSLATAAQQWQQAGQYQDLGNQAAERADPFGQYRRGYGDQLQGLYQDPSKIAETPGYKFAMNQALDETSSRLRGQGFLGSSQMQNALVDRASGLAQQTWNTEADRLARLAGAQFDPANAARMQMEGGKLKMDAQSNALGALMYPFGPSGFNGGQGGGGQGGGLPGMGGSNPFKLDGQTAQQLAKLGLSQVAPGLFRSASGVFFGGDGQILQDDSMFPISNTTDIPLEPFNPSPNDIFTPGDDYGYGDYWQDTAMPPEVDNWDLMGGGDGGFDVSGGWG